MSLRITSIRTAAKARSFRGKAVCALVAMTLGIAPALAQDEGSMQVGNATVTVGAGTAILTLPDITSFIILRPGVQNDPTVLQTFKFSDDFGGEIGWNINGSVAVPIGASKTVSLNGFWANIEDTNSFTCRGTSVPNTECQGFALVDPNPNVFNVLTPGFGSGNNLSVSAKRDVDHWGVSLETNKTLAPGVMGATRAPHKRSLLFGADIRGIDQDLDVTITPSNILTSGPATYNEDLNTRYYGAYAAWGGDYSLPFLSGVTAGLGLRSSFLLRGGMYYAKTDYEGVIIETPSDQFAATSALNLSRDKVAFIGGIVLETRKRIGRRTTLSLKSEYEYYSYVPDMAYNRYEVSGANFLGSPSLSGTSIGSNDAFSARTTLRLTIKFGPDSVFEEPLK